MYVFFCKYECHKIANIVFGMVISILKYKLRPNAIHLRKQMTGSYEQCWQNRGEVCFRNKIFEINFLQDYETQSHFPGFEVSCKNVKHFLPTDNLGERTRLLLVNPRQVF